MSTQLEQADTKAIQLAQKNNTLESQLADAQVCNPFNALIDSSWFDTINFGPLHCIYIGSKVIVF